MIVIDTNIVSEVMKVAPNPIVLNWLNHQITENLHMTTVTISEISYGLSVLPKGKRRRGLLTRFQQFVRIAFQDRLLNFGELAAYAYGDIMAHQKKCGRPMSVPDGQIAAIAQVNGCALATRNIRDFSDTGLLLINPFEQ
jgi:hypothetical protein